MARTPFVAGNWKMNTTKASAVALAKAVAAGAPAGGVEAGIAPPFVYLDAVSAATGGSGHDRRHRASSASSRRPAPRHPSGRVTP